LVVAIDLDRVTISGRSLFTNVLLLIPNCGLLAGKRSALGRALRDTGHRDEPGWGCWFAMDFRRGPEILAECGR
jgi:hypothetical protein